MKNFLKEIRLNESAISMALGILIVVVAGFLLISQFRDNTPTLPNIQTNLQSDIAVNKDADAEASNSYIVSAGDTLWSISEKTYGTGYEWSKIARANNISTPSEIEVGQSLILPSATDVSNKGEILDEAASTTANEEKDTNVVNPIAERQQPQQQIHADSYTVQHGDNLWNIAVQVYGDGYRWSDIAQANHLVNPNVIHSGNVFTLPS